MSRGYTNTIVVEGAAYERNVGWDTCAPRAETSKFEFVGYELPVAPFTTFCYDNNDEYEIDFIGDASGEWIEGPVWIGEEDADG